MVDKDSLNKKVLTQEDVNLLLKNPSKDVRVSTTEKLAYQFDKGQLSGDERHLAEEIFRILMHDAEVRVRETLAQNLKENINLPRDVAKTLAKDVDSVALPIIKFSEVLTTEDLISIVESQNEEKQKAVASRAYVQKEVSAVIASKACEDAVAVLVANEGAVISEDSFENVIQRFGESEKIQKPLVFRSNIPLTVAEKLVHKVSEELRGHLVSTHNLPPDVLNDLVTQSREKATIHISSQSSSDEDVKELVEQMNENGRLTTSIILRSICMGDVRFFEHALAIKSGIPVSNARLLIHDSGDLGLESLYKQAEQPQEMFPAVKAALDVMRETFYDGEANDKERFTRRMIERILTKYDEMGIEFENDDLEYLLSKMNAMPASA
ncbi:MAG: DUF2336 domain-containing protein [Alphaproteobacteria bacterium]